MQRPGFQTYHLNAGYRPIVTDGYIFGIHYLDDDADAIIPFADSRDTETLSMLGMHLLCHLMPQIASLLYYTGHICIGLGGLMTASYYN